MEHIKSKFKGVASYLKANANKWKKKDVLEKLKGKKEGAQARAMARGLSRAERKISRRNAEVAKLKAEDAAAKAALAAKAKLLRSYKRAMRSKLRKIKKVLRTKAQGNNKVWLRKALRKCHASKVALQMCKRTSKRLETRAALAARAGKVALNMCISKKKMYKEQAENCQPA